MGWTIKVSSRIRRMPSPAPYHRCVPNSLPCYQPQENTQDGNLIIIPSIDAFSACSVQRIFLGLEAGGFWIQQAANFESSSTNFQFTVNWPFVKLHSKFKAFCISAFRMRGSNPSFKPPSVSEIINSISVAPTFRFCATGMSSPRWSFRSLIGWLILSLKIASIPPTSSHVRGNIFSQLYVSVYVSYICWDAGAITRQIQVVSSMRSVSTAFNRLLKWRWRKLLLPSLSVP